MPRCLLTIVLALAACPLHADDPLPRTPDDPVPQLMETIGLLTSVQLYQTYLNIGLLADGRTEGLYADNDIKQLLASVLTPLDRVDKQLEKVAKLATTKDDKESLEKLRAIGGLLRQQGKDLETFWASGKEADGAKFEASRKKTWKELNALLEVEK